MDLVRARVGIREHVSCAAGPRPECSELRLSGRRHGQLHTEVSLDHDGAGTQCGHGFAVHADSEAGKHYVVVQRITSCLWQWRCFGSWPRCADADQNSGDAKDARLDSEGIRLSNDGRSVFISDEYGPYVYEFMRSSGQRIRSFRLPENLFVANLRPRGAAEIADNTSGRTANKGMEGLAITPDGKTLVGIVQASLIQDAAEGGAASKVLRIVTIDVETGKTTHEYAYLLTTGSGVSEIVALNQHEFLVDERDGKGLGDGSKAKVKQIFKIDLTDAVDVTGMDGTSAAANAVGKSLFLDIVKVLVGNGIAEDQIPAKLEGLALGPDVDYHGTVHTLWVANDNDFLQDLNGANTNPNQFFVFGFTDADLGGSEFVAQQPKGSAK